MTEKALVTQIKFDVGHLNELMEFIKNVGDAQFCLGITDRTAIIESIGMMLALSKGGLIGPEFHFEVKA